MTTTAKEVARLWWADKGMIPTSIHTATQEELDKAGKLLALRLGDMIAEQERGFEEGWETSVYLESLSDEELEDENEEVYVYELTDDLYDD